MSILKVDKVIADILRSPSYVSSPDAGHGEAGIIISPDPVGGGLVLYGSTDTYDPETGTGTYQILFKISDGKLYAADGNVIIDDVGLKVAEPADAITFYSASFSQTTGIVNRNSQDIYVGSLGTSATARNGVNLHAQETGGKYVDLWISIDPDPDESWATLMGYDFSGLLVSAVSPPSASTKPSSLLHIQSTAPSFRMEDTTGGALSWLQSLDANLMTFETTAGTDIVTFNLSTLAVAFAGDVSVGDDLTVTDDIQGDHLIVSTATASNGLAMTYTGASGSGNNAQISYTTNDGAALAGNDRLGTIAWNGHNGSSVVNGADIIVQADATWASGSERGTRISFFICTTGTETLATPFVMRGDSLTFADGVNLIVNATTGTKIGTATTQKLGFWNATPVVQPTAYTQTYSTANKTLNADGVTDPAAYGAGANGYSTAAMAQAVHAAVIALHADLLDTKQMLNSVIDDLQTIGILS